ncbi:hypothetical protein KC959_03990, partial [Candidatus Saccharibacteria bacterium]|nr:hypothetical protein [Candidatus Saccharibacteria bacterium]
VCRDNFPYLQWNVKATHIVPTQFTLKWFTVSGNNAGDPADMLVHTDTVAVADTTFDGTDTYSATTLWPGADTTQPDWPGWKLVNGTWVEDPTDFGGNLRESARLQVEVNPTDSTTVDYPPSTENCGPQQGQVLGTSTTKLQNTGANAWIQIVAGMSIVLIAVAALKRQKVASNK